MDKKEIIQDMVTKLKIIYAIITNKETKEVKKDYKYKKDDWEEILKGNDYY
jgi:Ribonuclease G/E